MLTRRNFGMKIWGKGLTGLIVAGALTLIVQPASAQDYHYNPEHRRPVEATLHHLDEVAAHNQYNGHERERFERAHRHLEQFAERLHEGGGFDKGKLDEAIGDLQSVVDHNPMPAEAHDILSHDAFDLRRLREHYDEHYRYQ